MRLRIEERGRRFDLISLMDVMFLILVFFVYSIYSLSVHRGIEVTLPSGAGSLKKEEVILVTMTKTGGLFLDGVSKPIPELLRDVTAQSQKGKRPVLLSADRDVPWGEGISLLEQLRQRGVKHVSVQVDGKTIRGALP